MLDSVGFSGTKVGTEYVLLSFDVVFCCWLGTAKKQTICWNYG